MDDDAEFNCLQLVDMEAIPASRLLSIGYEIPIRDSRPPYSLSLKLVFNLVQPSLDTVLALVLSLWFFMRVVTVTDECRHVGRESANSFSHPWAFGCEDDPLHPGLSVVTSISWPVGCMIAVD